MLGQVPISEITDPTLWKEYGLAGMVIICLFICNGGLIWYVGKVIDRVTARQDATVDKIDERHDATMKQIDQKHREDLSMLQQESWKVHDAMRAAIDRLSDTIDKLTDRTV